MTCPNSQRSRFLVSTAAVLAALVALQPQASAADKDGKKVTGTVVKAADGSPVAGATVFLIRRTGIVPSPFLQTRSDAAGRFTFEDVLPGTYRLFAESGNQISSRQRRKAEQVTVTSSEALPPATLRLAEGCRFRVIVKRAADNRPIANAKVAFGWADFDRHYETDSNGIVMIEGVRSEQQVFQVRADGYAFGEKTLEATQPGTTNDLSFLLGPGGQVEGTVRDADGRPLFNVRVGANAKRHPAELHIGTSKTDGKGRFKIENVPTGETIELSVTQKDYLRKEQPVTLKPDQKVLTVDLVLERRPKGGSVLVTVTGPDGKPVTNARLVNPGTNSSWRRYGRTDDRGECQLDDVYEIFGRHELGVTAKGFAPRQLSFDPGPPGKPSRLQVALEAGHRIHGRVSLGAGRFAAGVWVFYNHGEHGELIGGRVDAGSDGRFAIDSLPKGCTFTIYSPKGYAPFNERKLPLDTESEVLVTLEAASIVKGRVVDTVTRKPVVPYRIRIMMSHDRHPGEPAPGMLSQLVNEGLIITKSDGEFQFGDFPRGTPLRLMVTADGYQERAVDRVIALPNDQFKPLEIRILKLDPSMVRTVSGRLTNAAGKPVAGAQVRLWTATFAPEDRSRFPFNWTMITCGQLEQNESCRQFLTTSTDENGHYHFDGVRVAFYAEIDYWGTGIAPGRESILVPVDASQPTKFDFRAPAPARLFVEVDRHAWPKAAQIWISTDQPTLDYRTGSLKAGESKVTLDDLPAGTFNVVLQNAGRELGGGRLQVDTLAHREVVLKAGETVTVRFANP
ncbi:MAG TPA: carboxypeptidase regulatory-like domain-containing protein [Planctomycetaceae bacterium]|nr:carboxypeptidase regulatory-like domain-containing protein [Planctomycetaceae bacterium]